MINLERVSQLQRLRDFKKFFFYSHFFFPISVQKLQTPSRRIEFNCLLLILVKIRRGALGTSEKFPIVLWAQCLCTHSMKPPYSYFYGRCIIWPHKITGFPFSPSPYSRILNLCGRIPGRSSIPDHYTDRVRNWPHRYPRYTSQYAFALYLNHECSCFTTIDKFLIRILLARLSMENDQVKTIFDVFWVFFEV